MTLKEQIQLLETKVEYEKKECGRAYQERDIARLSLQALIEIACGKNDPSYRSRDFNSADAAGVIAELKAYKRFNEDVRSLEAAERDRLFLLVRSLSGDKTLEVEMADRRQMSTHPQMLG